MSQLKYIKGDLFATDCDIIAHGCNTQGGFASGVAGQVARLYPRVREAYLRKHETTGWELGQIQFCMTGNDRPPLWIVNMATQDSYGRTGVHVDYLAVEQCFKALFRHCEYLGDRIAIPRVGAGLGGGDWSRIESIILKQLVGRNLEVNVYTI
jgi:O-acetyl-ADP-ribose deacetylase (regulator of RNase III)